MNELESWNYCRHCEEGVDCDLCLDHVFFIFRVYFWMV